MILRKQKREILPHCSCKARYYLTRVGLIACPCLWRRISAFFFISNRNRSYEPSVWVRATNDNAGNKRKTYAHCDHTIKELPTNFLFWYDTGDDWTFICKKYQKEVERKSKEDIIVLEGAGNGIWEDNKSTLIAYLEGEIKDDNCNEKNEKKGFYKPWNVHIKKFSDFDQPINIKAIHNYIKQNRMSKK